mgnify:CR=1 FL=1
MTDDKYDEYRLNLMFDCYKWDPQFLDHNTVAKHAIVLSYEEYEELKIAFRQRHWIVNTLFALLLILFSFAIW